MSGNDAKLKELAAITEETERRAQQLELRIERFEALKGNAAGAGSAATRSSGDSKGAAAAVSVMAAAGAGGGAAGGDAPWKQHLLSKLEELTKLITDDQTRITNLEREKKELAERAQKYEYRIKHLERSMKEDEANKADWANSRSNPANPNFPAPLSKVADLFVNSPANPFKKPGA